MDKSKIRVDQVSSEDKSFKGLQNRGVVNFKCADCGKPLLVLQLVDTKNNDASEVLTRVAVRCGLCGGCSYVEQIPGQFYPGAPNDQMAFDVSEDDTCDPEFRIPAAIDVLFKAWSK